MTVFQNYAGIGKQPIHKVANIAALRLLTSGVPSLVYVQGASTINDGGQAFYQYISTDKTSADNGTTIIVDAAGDRWYISVGAAGGGGGAIQTVTPVAGVATIDYNQGTTVLIPVTANITSFVIQNAPAAEFWRLVLKLTVGGVGNYTTTWPTAWYAPGAGQKPILTTTVGASDIFTVFGFGSSDGPYIVSGGQNYVAGL